MNSLVAYKIYCYYNGLAEGNYKNFRRFMEVYYNVKKRNRYINSKIYVSW